MGFVTNPINASGAIHIKRNGNVATIFVDMVSESPLTLNGYDDSPTDGFPVTITVDDALQTYGTRIIWHDAPYKEPVLAKLNISEAELEAKIAEVRSQPASATLPPPPTNSVLAQSPAQIDVGGKAMNEFRLLMVKYDALEGKKKETFKIQVEAVANFILSVSPELAPALRQIKEEVSKPKFSL